MSKSKPTLESLYKQIPEFECDKSCSECCGPVPWAKEEWDRMEDKREHTSVNCPYSGENGCECYENRPFMCRLFGVSIDIRMTCPKGFRPKKLLSVEAAKNLTDKYMDNFFE